MKLAVVGSRKLTNIKIAEYISNGVDEIVSGGASGIDRLAAEYASQNRLTLTEFYPQYDRYGRAAPIVRNTQIVDYADQVLVFWDGSSKGTRSVIQYAKKMGKPIEVIVCEG